VIRQESSFDTATTSPVGARGLMQLMPATAATLAKHLGMAATPVALTADPSLNIRLGTAYLRDLLARFDGSVPLAVAAYNAGPARVAEWLSTYGDPTGSNVDVIDWIEMIPFSETRNYVQRVVENLVIYRAKRHEKLVHPLARWLR
jgi:soluble lytic murein transglycosylase